VPRPSAFGGERDDRSVDMSLSKKTAIPRSWLLRLQGGQATGKCFAPSPQGLRRLLALARRRQVRPD
jgi:hypothetical protein